MANSFKTYTGGNTEYGLLPGYFSNKFNSSNRDENITLAMNDGFENKTQLWSEFDRFYSTHLDNELPSGRHYIFICRPDLYLVHPNSAADPNSLALSSESRVNVDPYFNYLANYHPEIIASLTGDFAGMKSLWSHKYDRATNSGHGNSATTDGSKITIGNKSYTLPIHAFIPYLTTRVESLQLPDYTIKQNTIVQPYTKYTIPYTTSAIESSTGGTFDLMFREDRFYSIHKLFYAWIYYQNNVMRNIFRPKDKYIKYNALDYATSIYDFIVDETGENIIYWGKYTGCVPTSVPMSDLSFNRNSGAETKVSVSFSYFYYEHMDMNILMDFQYNSLGYVSMNKHFADSKMNPFKKTDYQKYTAPIYDSDTFLGKNFVGRPIIIITKVNDKPHIKLRWLP